MKNNIIVSRAKLEWRLQRATNEVLRLEKLRVEQSLSSNGFWALGYWKGRLSILEELLDDWDLEEFLNAKK